MEDLYKDAWTEVKESIDDNWTNFPLHQGTCDISEVLQIAEVADWYMLTNRQYNALINRGQKYFDKLNAKRPPKEQSCSTP